MKERTLRFSAAISLWGYILMPRFSAAMLPAIATMLGTCIACAQDYPNRTVRIVTASAGGGSDFTARVIAQAITVSLGQQVIVDNRPSGVIPGTVAAKSPPDGYTLLAASNSLWLAQAMQDNVPFDAVKDFLPVAAVAKSPSYLVVHPSVPANSVREFIALAKARPGQLNYGSGTTGGADHLAAELFKSMTGVDIVRIPYKNTSMQMADLIGGHLQLSFGTGGTVMTYVKTRRLRALAVTSPKPFSLTPEIPTVAASGVPGYEAEQILGFWVPARTPAAIVNRLNQEIVGSLHVAHVRNRFLNSGVETMGTSPEQFAAIIQSDIIKWGKVIKDAHIRVD